MVNNNASKKRRQPKGRWTHYPIQQLSTQMRMPRDYKEENGDV